MPLLARQQLLVDLTPLLCDYAAASGGATGGGGASSSPATHAEFEPRPGYVYGMDGTSQFRERAPDIPPIVVYICMTDDGQKKKEVGSGSGE